MRIYVKKSKDGFVIYKETLTQSLISDLVTMFVMAFLIGLDILFSIYVIHSVVIDASVVMLLLFYIYAIGSKKQETKSKKELEDIINEIID